MLVLTRRVGSEEWIQIGPDVQVRVIACRRVKGGYYARLAVQAPRETPVNRGPEFVSADGTVKPKPEGRAGGGEKKADGPLPAQPGDPGG